jgi:basic membrane protein A
MMKRLTRIAALALTLLLCIGLFVGCNSPITNPPPASDPTTVPETTASSAVLNADNAKIALLLCSAEMKSASARALWTVTEKFTAESGVTADWYMLPAPDDIKAQLDNIMAKGYTIVVNNNGMLNDYIKERAKDFPSVTFIAMEGWFAPKNTPDTMADYPNLVQGTVRAEESAFLAGYLLANATTTGKIGMLNGTPNPPGYQMEAGFRAGVEYAAKELGKEIATVVEYVGNGFNRTGGKEKAVALYNAGCDILYLCAGGETDWGALETAKALGKPVVTAGHASYIAPESVVGEVLKSKDPVITGIYQKLLYGEKVSGVQDHGLNDGSTGFAKTKLSDTFFGAPLLTKLDSVVEKIKTGEIVIPQNTTETLLGD